MLVGPSNTLFIDEISIGLDSSTTYEIVPLRHMVLILQEIALIFLLQPAPEMIVRETLEYSAKCSELDLSMVI